MQAANNFDLKLHLHRLLQDEPFFSAISRRVNKSVSRAIPTAGVTVDKETLQFKMLYNPDFFQDMPEKKVKGVLIHEFYHLVFKHVTSRKPEGIPNLVWNIACDLAINSMIGLDNLPENCCFPGVDKFEKYPQGKTAEFYLEMMKDDEQFGDGKGGFKSGEGEDSCGDGSENGNFDSHEGWGDLTESERQMVEERAKDIMEKAAKEANNSGRGWGSVSNGIKKHAKSAGS